MNNIGEQHRNLLVLRRSADLCDWGTALATELGVRWQFGAARPTRQYRRCRRTATAVIHVSIVSPPVNDVCHIGMRAILLGTRQQDQVTTLHRDAKCSGR
jgi:hypothetical protein